jgi:adenosylhomocysteinase
MSANATPQVTPSPDLVDFAFHPDFLGETARRVQLGRYPRVRQFVVQHLYPDTLRLLALLHQHLPIDVVIGISYSGDPQVVRDLETLGLRVLTPSYEALQATIDEELGRSLAGCRARGDELVLHEVGGYAIDSLHRRHGDCCDLVVGALEITKQGVWVAERLPELRIPQLNCAQTRLKEIEGRMVGESVVTALDVILRELGYAVTGRRALVTGYGWVGRGVAVGLKSRGMQVSCFDSDVIKRVEATVDGFEVPRDPSEALAPAMVVGATGSRSIGKQLIDKLPDRCCLVSGSSKDHEIDLPYLDTIARAREHVHPHVEALLTDDGRTLYLVNGGYPVNFTGSSVPDEIVEFLFAELMMLIPELLERRPAPGIYPLRREQEAIAAQIWLDLR